MYTKIFTIFDRVEGTYGPIFEHKSYETATRFVRHLKNNSPNFFPEDKQLYCVGEWDSDTADLVRYEKPVFVCEVADNE